MAAAVEETLSRIPLFSRMGPKELKKLGERMQERRFGEGQAIATEGRTGIGFFVIEEGSATVSRKGEVVGELGPGDFFGEVALIDAGTRSATVVAATHLRCRALRAADG
jgi:CRP-like cAMP-binding protein